jgi:hypothetical protein
MIPKHTERNIITPTHIFPELCIIKTICDTLNFKIFKIFEE